MSLKLMTDNPWEEVWIHNRSVEILYQNINERGEELSSEQLEIFVNP